MYHGHSHGRILGARANDRRGAKVPCETSIPKGRGEGINGLVFLGKSSPEITWNHGFSRDIWEFPVNCQPKSMELRERMTRNPSFTIDCCLDLAVNVFMPILRGESTYSTANKCMTKHITTGFQHQVRLSAPHCSDPLLCIGTGQNKGQNLRSWPCSPVLQPVAGTKPSLKHYLVTF